MATVYQQLDRFLDRELAVARQAVAQRLALDVWHDVVEVVSRLTTVVQRQDTGMLQVGGDLDLAEKSLWPDRCGQRGMEHLDRDLPVMLEVFGEVDRPHAAVAELALEPVALAQSLDQLRRNRAHEGLLHHYPPRHLGGMDRAVIVRMAPPVCHGGDAKLMGGWSEASSV